MYRAILNAALALALVTPARAQADNEVICAETSRIVQIAVVQRAGGMQPASIKRGMTDGRYKVGERFIPTVGPLVDWVFSIEESELRAPGAAEAITGRYRTGCLGFKP